MYLLEVALTLPVIILGATALVDTTNVLRTKNALKQAAQESVRCLTTTDSPCAIGGNRPPATRLFRYFRSRATPKRYGHLHTIPTTIDERVAPLQRYQFDATVLDTVYSAQRQQQFQDVSFTYRSAKEVAYVQERFDYYVHYAGGTHQVLESQSSTASAVATYATTNLPAAVQPDGGIAITFTVPAPAALSGFTSASVCSTNRIQNGGSAPAPCLLTATTTNGATQLLSSMMILLEGSASGGVLGRSENAQVTLQASYTHQGRTITVPLGGQQFPLNGTTHQEDFVPRGSPSTEALEERYGGVFVDPASPYHGGELTAYPANSVILPFNKPITLRLAFATKPASSSARWQPSKLSIYTPTFTNRTVSLLCTNAPSCRALDRQSTRACTTVPEVAGGTIKISLKNTSISSAPSACLTSAAPLNPDHPRYATYSINNQECVDYALRPVDNNTCPQLITAAQCSGTNKGTPTSQSPDGLVWGNSAELERDCAVLSRSAVSAAPTTASIPDGQAVGTLRTIRLTDAHGTPLEVSQYRTGCDGLETLPNEQRPPMVKQYHHTTPVLMGTIPSQERSLPPDAGHLERQALSCLPTRAVPQQDHAQILGDYAFLLAPHPDLGCSRAEILKKAEETVEKDSRYELSFESPVIGGRFEFPPHTGPDACTPFSLSTPEVDPTDLELLGTFPETDPPAPCASEQCIREFAGFDNAAPSSPSSVNLAEAIAQARRTAVAYLPNRTPEEIAVTIVPPEDNRETPGSYRVTTTLNVPLSFSRQSTVVHVAHGRPEVTAQ